MLDETLRWLELPQHHFLCADSEIYPSQLRAIDDYPGAIFIDGDPARLHTCQLCRRRSRSHSAGMGERWDVCLRKPCEKRRFDDSPVAFKPDGVAHNVPR